jgi:hypothetical protein
VQVSHGYANVFHQQAPSGIGYVEALWSLTGGRHRYDGEHSRRHLPKEFIFIDRSAGEHEPYFVLEIMLDDAGVPKVRAVLAHAHDGGREVRTADLRRLRSLEDILEEAAAMVGRPTVDEPSAEVEADWRQYRQMVRGVRRQSRRRVTPALLQEVADVYHRNLDSGAPTKAVRTHFGLAESTASLYVKRARAAGLLDGISGGVR